MAVTVYKTAIIEHDPLDPAFNSYFIVIKIIKD